MLLETIASIFLFELFMLKHILGARMFTKIISGGRRARTSFPAALMWLIFVCSAPAFAADPTDPGLIADLRKRRQSSFFFNRETSRPSADVFTRSSGCLRMMYSRV